MKAMIYILTILLLFAGLCSAQDQITVEGQQCNSYEGYCGFTVGMENTQVVTELNLGFRIYSEADEPYYGELDNFFITNVELVQGSHIYTGLDYEIVYDTEPPVDSFWIIGRTIPGEFDGIQPGGLDVVIEVTLDCLCTGPGGYIFIDTITNIPPDLTWGYDYTVPQFNEGSIHIWSPPCGTTEFTIVPDNDILTGPHDIGVEFQFDANNPLAEQEPNPDTIVLFDMLCCPENPPEASISYYSGLFNFAPASPGTYDVCIRAEHACNPDWYNFQVQLTNEGQEYTNKPSAQFSRPPGDYFSYDLELVNYDTDPIIETVDLINSSGGFDPVNLPIINDGIFSWIIDTTELGYYEFRVIADDQFGMADTADLSFNIAGTYICGDVNDDYSVDISDAVYLVNYAFGGGEQPYPIESGDVNCDYFVDISDAVYVISYSFGGGFMPCDTNGDYYLDCYTLIP